MSTSLFTTKRSVAGNVLHAGGKAPLHHDFLSTLYTYVMSGRLLGDLIGIPYKLLENLSLTVACQFSPGFS